MYKLRATIRKDLQILIRDKIGLTFMFGMPILLVMVVTAIQSSTFDLVNKNKLPLLVSNRDTGSLSTALLQAIDQIGLFKIQLVPPPAPRQTQTAPARSPLQNPTPSSYPAISDIPPDPAIASRMHDNEAMLAIIIPANFSTEMDARARNMASKALNSFGLQTDSLRSNIPPNADPLTLYYNPVLQESFRLSVNGAIGSAVQLVESKQVLRILYLSINGKPLPDSLEKEMLHSQLTIDEIPLSMNGSRKTPNAAQHNVPAWTIFAMFFIVLSLSGSIVREKRSGSFIRLRTLPTPYPLALLSRQITYLCVTLIQAATIFAIGIWIFPLLGLPALGLPPDLSGLFLVSLLCGWCAVSYAICIGVFARTQEQANGFGAVSIVILAAIGGLMVPAFAMPASFTTLIRLSPLHWCLEAYYSLFLEGGRLKDIVRDIIPLLAIAIGIQLITLWGLKIKKLI
jgi:ABC-2 type transport system permease protein